MSENERPAASGIEEIFGTPANHTAERAETGDGQNAGHSGDGQKKYNRHGYWKKHWKNNRKPYDKSRDNVRPGTDDADAADFSGDVLPMNDAEAVSDAFADTVGEVTEYEVSTDSPAMCEIVGIRFKDTGKTYYFAPGELKLAKGECAVVETARGLEYGFVSVGNTFVPASDIVPPLRTVVRAATEADAERYEENTAKEKEAFITCLDKIREHRLEMKLIDAEYTFDQSKLTFYFSADGRVDFRELVKDLASVFRTRIELRQIGIRDEAKLVGGLGVCGRPFCCSTFLSDFVQVSIKMAKEQNLSLNSAKISGACGRLMCCLRYEHETYEEEIKKTPSVGCHVKTDDGIGVVVETSPLRGKVKVKIGDEQNAIFREFDRDAVTVLPKKRQDGNTDRGNADDGSDVIESDE